MGQEEGAVLRVVRPIQKHCKSLQRTPEQKVNNGISCGVRSKKIIPSSIAVCSEREHPILNIGTTCYAAYRQHSLIIIINFNNIIIIIIIMLTVQYIKPDAWRYRDRRCGGVQRWRCIRQAV